jgi:DNA-binding transcriptional ArsR family regulator
MELAEVVGEPAATVSEHLKVLRKTRLVVLRADGRYRLYRADPQVVEEVREALARLGAG